MMTLYYSSRSVHALISKKVLPCIPCRNFVSQQDIGSHISLPSYQKDDPLRLAQEIFSRMARRTKTWKRLGHLIDLGCNISPPISSIADIGCDHGFLSVGLAVSGKFQLVVGTDVSPLALQNAISFQQGFYKRFKQKEKLDLNVEFRLGYGIEVLCDAEIQAICLAGMGVDTMKNILTGKELDRIGCCHVLTQPTNSRPRNLCIMYDHLQEMGWRLKGERIEYLSSRWYISSLFSRQGAPTSPSSKYEGSIALPGDCLKNLHESDPMSNVYKNYIDHHISWLHRDLKVTALSEEDTRWLNAVETGIIHADSNK